VQKNSDDLLILHYKVIVSRTVRWIADGSVYHKLSLWFKKKRERNAHALLRIQKYHLGTHK